HRARRAGARDHALRPMGRAGPARGSGGRSGLRRRRSPARAGRHRLRRRGERDSGMARPAASDLKRRRRGDRRALARPRSGAVSGGTPGAGAAAAQVAVAAQLACLLEASAPKPGNVHPGAAFHDTSYHDFLASAAAIGPAFGRAGEQPLGRTIREAIEATARWVPRNSNLGIVLLLSPLARAALERGRRSLRDALTAVLAATTVDDAADAYAAIRLAPPGGPGHAPEQDTARPPTARRSRPSTPSSATGAIPRIRAPRRTSPPPRSSSHWRRAAGARQGDGAMPARSEFKVTVTKDNLVFASAHFITFPGHRCETLHGHNYRTRVVIEGGLDAEAHYVFDFSALKD